MKQLRGGRPWTRIGQALLARFPGRSRRYPGGALSAGAQPADGAGVSVERDWSGA